MVVLSSATAVPVLPGSLTEVGGSLVDIFTGPTTVPVNGLLGLTGRTTVLGGVTQVVGGSTTVVGGVTEVVISGPTTVAVASPTGENFLQVSGAGRLRGGVFGFLGDVVRGFGGRFM